MTENKKPEQKGTFTKDFFLYLGVFGIIVMLICAFPFLFTRIGLDELDFSNTGQIGDTIGGVMGPFVAIAAAILTFLAFWVQYKANKQQRDDISLERFENNLFQLIQMQEEITNNLNFTSSDGADELSYQVYNGRQIFSIIYNNKKYFSDVTYWGLKSALEQKGIHVYESDKDIYILDHYFRHLYRVFKYIDDSTIINKKEKYKYTSIMRASLSQYELIILFYNCLSKNGAGEFKRIIETYALFNNLRIELLATEKELYSSKCEEYYCFTQDADLTTEYKKGAFVFKE